MVEKNDDIIENCKAYNISSQKISLKETRNFFLPEQDSTYECEYTSLWKAVITQALMDAGSNSKKPEFKKEKARAISWPSGDSDDFYQVCVMADMDPEYVKSKAKEAIKGGCKWRKESNPFKKADNPQPKTKASEPLESAGSGFVTKSLFI